MRVGINSTQAYATDNKPNIPDPLPSRLILIAFSILCIPLISYRYQDQSIPDVYLVHWE